MQFNNSFTKIRVFAISPRTIDLSRYWTEIQNTIQWSEKYNFTGVLIFTGNDTYVEPWLTAHTVLAETEMLSPLVAVNPVYMHPFCTAKMVSSLVHLYKRRIYLNMVTGAALNYLEALGDSLSHDERYARMSEHIQIVNLLLTSPNPVSFSGIHYQVSHLQLLPRVPTDLAPEFLLAGASKAARNVCSSLGALGMAMLGPDLNAVPGCRGIHFGLITRPTRDLARRTALETFPCDEEAQEMLDYSMGNTDSVWKQNLRREAGNPALSESGYWLGPFRNFKVDCPYVVDEYEKVAELMSRLIRAGVHTFILDLVPNEEEYAHAAAAFNLVKELLG